MTTDDDILAALKGRPSGQHKAIQEATINALRGGQSATDRAYHSAVLEALGHKPAAGAEAGPAQRRGDSIEPVSIWAAREAAAAATKSLAEAIMRADGTKGIFLAEEEAKQIAAEAYTEAAKGSPYEDKRQEAVSRIVTKLAERLSRITAGESKPKPKPTAPKRPTPRQEAAGVRHVRITEGGSGRITVLP